LQGFGAAVAVYSNTESWIHLVRYWCRITRVNLD